MTRIEEISLEWEALRSSIGTLINHVNGQLERLKCLDEAYQKGMKDGRHDAYEQGLADAWEAARKIVDYPVAEMDDLFVVTEWSDIFENTTAAQAVYLIKEYEKKKTNGSKFVEVFGFMPGYEILGDGRSYYPSLEKFFESEYKPPEGKDE